MKIVWRIALALGKFENRVRLKVIFYIGRYYNGKSNQQVDTCRLIKRYMYIICDLYMSDRESPALPAGAISGGAFFTQYVYNIYI